MSQSLSQFVKDNMGRALKRDNTGELTTHRYIQICNRLLRQADLDVNEDIELTDEIKATALDIIEDYADEIYAEW